MCIYIYIRIPGETRIAVSRSFHSESSIIRQISWRSCRHETLAAFWLATDRGNCALPHFRVAILFSSVPNVTFFSWYPPLPCIVETRLSETDLVSKEKTNDVSSILLKERTRDDFWNDAIQILETIYPSTAPSNIVSKLTRYSSKLISVDWKILTASRVYPERDRDPSLTRPIIIHTFSEERSVVFLSS